jgi:hypothetical protein
MLRFQRALAAEGVPEPAHCVWAGNGECGARHALIVALRRGRVAHASATPRYLLPAILGRSRVAAITVKYITDLELLELP